MNEEIKLAVVLTFAIIAIFAFLGFLSYIGNLPAEGELKIIKNYCKERNQSYKDYHRYQSEYFDGKGDFGIECSKETYRINICSVGIKNKWNETSAISIIDHWEIC